MDNLQITELLRSQVHAVVTHQYIKIIYDISNIKYNKYNELTLFSDRVEYLFKYLLSTKNLLNDLYLYLNLSDGQESYYS